MSIPCSQCRKLMSSSEAYHFRDEDLGESWMNLTESTASNVACIRKDNSMSNLHADVERNRKVKEIAFSDETIAPICEVCTQVLFTELIEARDLALKESEVFTCELNRLSQLAIDEDSDDSQLEELLRQAEQEERDLIEKSKWLELERATLCKRMKELNYYSVNLERKQNEYWRFYNEVQLQLRSQERESLKRKVECASQQLETLSRTNVINDAFHISHHDVYGTINGFRLGSIQSQPVEWDEINAAWGQVCLLLQTLAIHHDFIFPKYRLVPMGSSSRIIRREDEAVLDLHCPSDISFGRLFGYGTFDKGMAGAAECLASLGEHVGRGGAWRAPLGMQEDRVEGASVRLQLNTYDAWTRALRGLLANLKALLAASVPPP